MNDRAPIILASQSPRRAQLLREMGIDFEVVLPTREEPTPHGWQGTPAEFAESAGYFKAAGLADTHPGRTILAADTIVAVDGQIIGKARDRDHAREILRMLTSTPHEVISGVSLLRAGSDQRLIDHAVTRVFMRTMSESELEAYLDSGEWEGKAGAYAIQESADRYVQRIEGSFSNVVGLPVELLGEMFEKFNSL